MAIFAYTGWMAFGGDGKYKNSVNYVKGMKALQDSNYAEAMKYLNREIAKNPDNGYAYYGLGMTYEATGNPSEALDNFNIAIKNIPSDDNYSIALAYSLKARVLRRLDDLNGAMENFNKAVETCPESADFYVMRGMEFRDHGKLEQAEKDFREAVSLDKKNTEAYVGLAEIAYIQRKYAEVIRLCNYINKLAPDHSYAYMLRAKVYMSQNKYREAVNDIVEALNAGDDKQALTGMRIIADSMPEIVLERLKKQKEKYPNDNKWNFYLGMVCEQAGDFSQAAVCYEEMYKSERSDEIAVILGNCYKETGMTEKALKYYQEAKKINPASAWIYYEKSVAERGVGMYSEALADINSYIAAEPDDESGYAVRGMVKYYMGDDKGAVDDFTTAIKANNNDVLSLLYRGILYDKAGERKKAVKDFEHVVRVDTKEGENSSAAYAYRALADKKKSEKLAAQILSRGKHCECYNIACMYSEFGETSKALMALKTAFEKGFRRFDMAECAPELENVRKLAEFNGLVNECKAKMSAHKG